MTAPLRHDPVAEDLVGPLEWIDDLTDAQALVLVRAIDLVLEDYEDDLREAKELQAEAAANGDRTRLAQHVTEYRQLQRESVIAETLRTLTAARYAA